MHVSTSIYWYTQSISGRTRIIRFWESGCNKHSVNDTYIDIIIQRAGAVVMINVGLAQAHPN